MRLVLYTGKGGVGKTTTAAATAVCAAERGRRTLVASADPAHSLGDVIEHRLDGGSIQSVAPGLDALEIDARRETERHWGHVREYLVDLFRHQGIERMVAEELALLPGAEELVALLAVEEQARRRRYDLIVVDCAPSDAALRMLTLPEVAHSALRLVLRLQQAVASVVTPLARGIVAAPLPDADVFRDAEQLVYQKLRRLARRVAHRDTTVRLVLTPERMVIEEARRTFSELALFELACDGVVLNRLLPSEAANEPFFREWCELEATRREEVERCFAPLPVLAAPLQDDEVSGLERLSRHGAALFAKHEPEARLAEPPRLAFEREASGYRVRLPVLGLETERLEVAKLDGDLVVGTSARRRAIRLPRRVAALPIASARIEAGDLVVRFGAGASRPGGA